MLEQIIVALDGSSAAESALALTRAMGCAPETKVVVVHVSGWGPLLRPVHGLASPAAESEAPAEAHRLVNSAVAQLTAAGVDARGQVLGRFDTTARELLDAAAMTGSRLIVMGMRGRGRVAAPLLGGVAHRVIHLAEIPVLLTPELPVARTRRLKRLLVAVDGSYLSWGAVDAAAAVARRAAAEVVVLHVATAEDGLRQVSTGQSPAGGQTSDTSLELVEHIAADMRQQGLSVSAEVRVSSGNVARDIIEVATGLGCDMVVAGSRGRSALSPLVLGSTTYQLVHLAEFPVLVVR